MNQDNTSDKPVKEDYNFIDIIISSTHAPIRAQYLCVFSSESQYLSFLSVLSMPDRAAASIRVLGYSRISI